MGFDFMSDEIDPCKDCYGVPCDQCPYSYKDKNERARLYAIWKKERQTLERERELAGKEREEHSMEDKGMTSGVIKLRGGEYYIEAEVKNGELLIHFPEDADLTNWYHGVTIDRKQSIPPKGNVRVWKPYYRPFIMGGTTHGIFATELTPEQYCEVDLGKGFRGIEVLMNNRTYVFDKESGGHVGDTADQVRADINACDDIEAMKAQSAQAKIEGQLAPMVSNEEFFR